MTGRQPHDELRDLLWSIEDGSISAGGIERIDELVRGDPELLRHYIEYTRLLSDLRFGLTNGRAHDVLGRLFDIDQGNDECGMMNDESPTDAQSSDIHHPSFIIHHSEVPNSEPLVPPIIIDTSTPPGSPLFFLNPSLGGWLFSYSAATVITGVLVLIFWMWKVSLRDEVAESPRPAMPPSVAREMEPVGRITGTADCRWANAQTAPRNETVPLGRKYEFVSGLMEIAYQSGAKVILQGPCTYEVDSAAGGFLSLGKLTARVETKGEGGRGKAEEMTNQNSPFPPPPSPFVVKTPTAIVTDLGTEFGVEVTGDHRNRVYVFEGRVAVRPAAGKTAKPDDLVLGEGQSVALDANGAVLESPPSREAEGKGSAAQFVRRMPLPAKLGVLDLLDIVAGGDGTGHLREQGISPVTGAQRQNLSAVRAQRRSAVPPRPVEPAGGRRLRPGRQGRPGATRFRRAYLPPTRNLRHGTLDTIWARGADMPRTRRPPTGVTGFTPWGGAGSTCPKNAACWGCARMRA